MSQNVYEGLFVLDSNRYNRDVPAASARIGQLVEKAGGEMIVSRLWEERRLAYPINGQRKGTYWLTYFRIESGQLPELNQQSRREELILRHLFLKLDPRIVDALVEHAQASPEQRKAQTPTEAVAAATHAGGDAGPDEEVPADE